MIDHFFKAGSFIACFYLSIWFLAYSQKTNDTALMLSALAFLSIWLYVVLGPVVKLFASGDNGTKEIKK